MHMAAAGLLCYLHAQQCFSCVTCYAYVNMGCNYEGHAKWACKYSAGAGWCLLHLEMLHSEPASQ